MQLLQDPVSTRYRSTEPHSGEKEKLEADRKEGKGRDGNVLYRKTGLKHMAMNLIRDTTRRSPREETVGGGVLTAGSWKQL